MKLFLHPLSAISFWLATPLSPAKLKRAHARDIADFHPTEKTDNYLLEALPYLQRPVHVLVTSGRRNPKGQFRFHRLPKSWADMEFCLIAPGVYAPLPEAAFAAMGQYLTVAELVYLGGIMCGGFFFDPKRAMGITQRYPITAPCDLKGFVEGRPGFRGVVGVRPALAQIQAGAESPPEVFMRMALCLPRRYGGLAVAGAGANWSYLPSDRARAISGRGFVRPDLLFRNGSKVVAVEYDSDIVHLAREQASRDESKRLALEADGIKVVSIRPTHLADPSYMKRVAGELERYLGLRGSVEPDDFYLRQERLFHLDRRLIRFLPLA